MRYAVVDFKWFSKPSFMFSQISGIMFDSDHNELSRIYHVIRPERKAQWNELKRMGVDTDIYKKGINESSARKKFVCWLDGCNKIIVWNRNTEDVLRKLFGTHKPQVYPEIEVAQVTYEDYFLHCSLEKLYRRYNIKTDNPADNAMNNCSCISQLYRIAVCGQLPGNLKQRYRSEENEHSSDIADSPYYAIAGSSVFHHKNCFHVKNRQDGRLIPLFNYCHADLLEYRACKCCKPEPPAKQSSADNWDLKAIKNYCSKLNFKCRVKDEQLYIMTGVATWFFFINRTYIVLYHENLRPTRYDRRFHIQKQSFTDPLDTIFYIYCHDIVEIKKKKRHSAKC